MLGIAGPLLGRLAAGLACAALLAAMLLVRHLGQLDTPRVAMAAAPGGGAYVVSDAGRIFRLKGSGPPAPGASVAGTPEAMAAAGDRLLIGTDIGLYLSADGGRTVLPAAGTHGYYFLTVALSGQNAVASAWDQAIWLSHDGGMTWSRSPAGREATYVNAFVPLRGGWLAAGPAGVEVSTDRGETWRKVPGAPERGSALLRWRTSILLATWTGEVFESPDEGGCWKRVAAYPAGIWSLAGAGDLVGTATGLFSGGRRQPGTLASKEIVDVVESAGRRYAAGADHSVWAQTPSGGWRRLPLASPGL